MSFPYVNGLYQRERREGEAEVHREGRAGHFRYISGVAQRKFKENRETQRKLDVVCEELQRTLSLIDRCKEVY